MQPQNNANEPQQAAKYASEQRSWVHEQVPNNQTFKCIFSRRKPKVKKQKTKFYFYSEDTEELILAATSKKSKGLTYKISSNSKDIKRKSMFFIGLCSDVQTKKIFLGTKSFPEKPGVPIPTIRFDTSNDWTTGNKVMIAPPEAKDFQFPTEIEAHAPEGAFSLNAKILQDTANADKEFINISVTFRNDETALKMHQIAEDEFEVEMTYPLSIFQSFCLACVLTNL